MRGALVRWPPHIGCVWLVAQRTIGGAARRASFFLGANSPRPPPVLHWAAERRASRATLDAGLISRNPVEDPNRRPPCPCRVGTLLPSPGCWRWRLLALQPPPRKLAARWCRSRSLSLPTSLPTFRPPRRSGR